MPDGEAIITALHDALERSDAVIVTGGIGPTSDDISREAAADVLGVELITDEAALRSIEEFFAQRGAKSPLPVPPITIESVVQAKTRALRGKPGDEESWADFDAVFREALLNLERAGCDFAIIAWKIPRSAQEYFLQLQ